MAFTHSRIVVLLRRENWDSPLASLPSPLSPFSSSHLKYGTGYSVAAPFSSTMVLVQLAASPKGRTATMSSTRSTLSGVAVGAESEAAKTVAGPLGLKKRLRDDHAQPPAGLQVAIGRGVEHQHREVFLAAAVPGVVARKREQAVVLPQRLGGLAILVGQIVPGDPGRIADHEIERRFKRHRAAVDPRIESQR